MGEPLTARTMQKGRTRAALLAAARTLLAEGRRAGVGDAAELAGISRATAYRYFSDAETLAAEAVLDIEVAPTEDLIAGAGDVRARVHAVRAHYLDLALRHEAGFRGYLARTMGSWAARGAAERPRLRGARRIAAFRAALAPDCTGARARTLAELLSLTTGIEAVVTLRDVAGLDPETAEARSRAAADALLDAWL